eukprot:g1177.t1
MRFETTTSAQARTNRKQRNIGNLAKGACGPCPVACRSQGSRNSCAGRGLEGFGRCVGCKVPDQCTRDPSNPNDHSFGSVFSASSKCQT